MPISFVEKFDSVRLDRTDEPDVLKAIVETRDPGKLLSYIYIYGYSFEENKKVLNVCDYYIKNPVPGLTAKCMRVAVDYWNKFDRYYDVLERFLDINLFDEWYDEIIFTVSFINRHKDIDFPAQILDKFNDAIKDPQISSLDILKPSLGDTRSSKGTTPD